MKSWKETPILTGFKKWSRRNSTFLGYKKVTADAKLDLISKDLLILDRYICTINHMFGRAICDKFPSEFLKAFRVKWGKKWRGWFIPKIPRIKHVITCDYLITTCDYMWSNQSNKHFVLKRISFNNEQLQISERTSTE